MMGEQVVGKRNIKIMKKMLKNAQRGILNEAV